MVETLRLTEQQYLSYKEKRTLGVWAAALTLSIGSLIISDHISNNRAIENVQNATRTEIIIKPGDRLENIAKYAEASDGIEGNVSFHLYARIIQQENGVSASDFPAGKRILIPDHRGRNE